MHPTSGDPSGTRHRYFFWRAVLTWGVVWIATVQASVVAFLEWRHPEFLDPKYGCRLLALRTLREQEENRKLLLVLGSSRAEQGFRPSLLTQSGRTSIPSAPGAMFYNMARGSSSPLLYLLTVRRLLADGIHPDGVLIEIFPPALVEDAESAVIYKPALRDWPILRRYPVNRRTWAFWLQDRLLLWYKYRSGFLAFAAPQCLLPNARWGEHLWDYRGGEWRIIGDNVCPQERRRLIDDARRRYVPSLQHFRIDADADRALRELLETCRSQRIAIVLFLMPESSEFRSWYPPEALCQLSDYLERLRRDYDAPVIDARCWLANWFFSDGHHLLRRGAELFTRRFSGEVLSVLDRATLASRRRTP